MHPDNMEFVFSDEDLLRIPGWQQFLVWIDSPGGRKIAQYCFKYAAYFGRRYKAYGRRVSMKLIWEQVRDHYGEIKRRAKRRGIDLKQWNGYALNNDFHAHMARFIEKRRPDWAGMFEKRLRG